MQSIPNRSNRSTGELTYETLKRLILNLELKPGTKLSEKEVAEKLQVSRTPVREAFLKLSQEELLEIYPQSGTFVSFIDLEHVEEARFVRENIERAIVREACKEFSEDYLFQLETNIATQDLSSNKGNYSRMYQLDDEFHRLLFYGCGKVRSWNMLQQMNSHFNRLRILRLSSSLDWDIIISQHKEIFNLIKNKESDKVEQVIIKHLRLAVFEKEILIERYPEYFNPQKS
ncbi:GntR family transcriptional regulator [Pullulanibacillus camelliae]|uniref:GntR family transcriptional regulator n=1 Tax=Pullulanibacillus camelliae TaxID=1707096 RepID=A0A8J2VHZ7_9BACL|nr:GntR family transcriptional regulator [Pullulanibacillus camelliae]